MTLDASGAAPRYADASPSNSPPPTLQVSRIDPEVDVRQRVETDRDFARIRDQPQFRKGLEGVLRPAPPQVPTAR